MWEWRYGLIAADREQDFFARPSITSYSELRKAFPCHLFTDLRYPYTDTPMVWRR